MKSRFIVLVTALLTTSLLIGCGAESTSNQIESATETTTEESTTKQTIEATATPEATQEPSEEVVTEAETTESTETAEAVVESESDEASEPEQEPEAPVVEETTEAVPELEFTVIDLNATKYATQSVNVRSGPSTDYDKIGGLTTNQEVQVTGQASTGWYRFTWTDGSEAYVSNKYLSDSKVEVAPPANNNGSGSAASGKKNWQDYYQDHVWYDMDRFFFIIVDSREEGTQTLDGNNVDYSGAEATLQARFPDEKVYLRFGCPLRDGHWMFFAYIQNSGLDPFIRPFE